MIPRPQNRRVEDNGSQDGPEHTGIGSDTAREALIRRRKLEARPLPDSELEQHPSRPGATPRQQDAAQENH